MFDLVTAVTLGMQGKFRFLDPTYNEESICCSFYGNVGKDETENAEVEHGIVVLSILSTHQQISELYQTGCLSLNSLTESIDGLIDANNQIVPLVQKCLVKFVLKHIKNKNEDEE